MLRTILLLTGALAALSADDAATQVSRTLTNLLASLEEEGKQAQARAAPRKAWCDKQLEAMQAEVSDYQDEAEQAKADLGEVKAAADEIAAAADTLQRELKGKTGVQKASLDNQLSAELPLLASKRSTATELARRSGDLKHVLSAETQSREDLEAECKQVNVAEDAQAKDRMQVAMLLEKAKGILAPAPAFVQVTELATAAAEAQNVAAGHAAARLEKARAPTVDPLSAARDQLSDLAKLINSGASKDEQAKCADQVKTNELLLAWKQDELTRLDAEEKAHQQGVEQAAEDIKTVESTQKELRDRKAALDKFDSDGKSAEEKLQKDHVLLSKVVAQATTVLAATDHFKDGVAALQQVSTLLAQLPDVSVDYARAVRSADRAASALDLEAGHLKLAQSAHEVSLQEMKQEAEAATKELAQVQDYLGKLRENCAGTTEKERRAREVSTLNDAVRDLNGAAGGVPKNLPGPIQPEVAAKLSPLERAAMEMGVAAN
jgi:chromosome segregation ATPase